MFVVEWNFHQRRKLGALRKEKRRCMLDHVPGLAEPNWAGDGRLLVRRQDATDPNWILCTAFRAIWAFVIVRAQLQATVTFSIRRKVIDGKTEDLGKRLFWRA